LEYLILALDKLRVYDFIFAIAGSGEPDYVNQIEDLLEAHNLSDRTHFVGFVRGETKNLYLQGADLFALTSHSENFGIAVVEALAAGTPVLITDQVPIATIVEKYEIGYVTKLDIEAIAIALEAFLQNFNKNSNKECPNPQKFQQAVQQNYSWQSISLQLTKIYESLCP
jgi:glycosyltransferase involved in cell wall biosynthesis